MKNLDYFSAPIAITLFIGFVILLFNLVGCQKDENLNKEIDVSTYVDEQLIETLPKCTEYSQASQYRSFPMFNMCQCADGLTGEAEGLESSYKLYRKAVIINNSQAYQEFYTGAEDYIKFNSYVGLSSPDIYDFDSDGKVGTSDLLPVLSGWGNQPDTTYNLCNVQVNFPNSHGWPSSYPGAYFSVVHTTQIDEDGDGTDMCPLNTFRLELVYLDSTLYLWYH